MMSKNLCKLCQSDDELQESHILPKFLGKYLKNTSATGYLMGVDTNGKIKRSQDLFKVKLLCKECERLLNKSETFFANTIFHPYQRGSLKRIPQSEQISRFTVSVSLRVLWMMNLIQHPLAIKWKAKLNELENEWCQYLLGTPDFVKGVYSHHILLSNISVLSKGLRNSPNLILSIMRSSAYYIYEKFGKAYLFSNLAGVQIISMIHPAILPVSQGTEVYPNQTFGVISAGIGWGGYYHNLLDFAEQIDTNRPRLTIEQSAKIEESLRSNPDKAMNSEDIRIIQLQNRLKH